MIPVRAHRVPADETPWNETPFLPIEALATALAVVAGRGAYDAEDMADAARATVDLRGAKIEVRPGLVPGPQSGSMAALATTLAWARLKPPASYSPGRPKPTPRDIADAEWVRAELRNLGFDLWTQ